MIYLIYFIISLYGLYKLYLLLKKRTIRRFILHSKMSVFKVEKMIKDRQSNNVIFYTAWMITFIINALLIYFAILGANHYYN